MMRPTESGCRRRTTGSIAVLCVLVVASGCSFDPAALAVPGTGVSGETYSLSIEFANVLNLPLGADVIADGVEAGTLVDVRIVAPESASGDAARAGYVVADVEITESTRVTAETRAELRQATPLGDVHIALLSAVDDNGPLLTDGATISIDRTSQAPQVEDTLAGLASVVGGGAVDSLQNTVRQMNSVFPVDPAETARIFSAVENDIAAVGADVGSVDAILDGLGANAALVLDDRDMLDPLLTDYGVQQTTAVVTSTVGVMLILAGLGPVAHSALWLAPLVQSLDRTATAVVPMVLSSNPLDLSQPTNLSKFSDLLRTRIFPFVEQGPKVDVTMSESEQSDQIATALRMIGAVR
jgi:phospholipid/cholesterol/gamma-HCH transport system substrate-binding protein